MTALTVKICGVTQPGDAAFVATVGADMIGLNFWPRSKRFVSAAQATAIAAAARAARPQIEVVAVFVNPTDADIAAADAACAPQWLQLHGDETPERTRALGKRAFKACSIAEASDVTTALHFPGSWVLFDAPCDDYGGSGTTFDWSLLAPMASRSTRWLLAGGLTPDNVAAAVGAARPDGVDVASGVERRPGEKDPDKVRAFIDAVRRTT